MEKSFQIKRLYSYRKSFIVVAIFTILMFVLNFWGDEAKQFLTSYLGMDHYLWTKYLLVFLAVAVVTLLAVGLVSFILEKIFGVVRLQSPFVTELDINVDININPECSAEKFDRFEDVRTHKVKVGFIPFEPTLEFKGGEMMGPGAKFIEKIFNGKAENAKIPSTWASVLRELEDGKFDIIATPVYDFPSRRDNALLSMPLYYANMGFYVARESKLGRLFDDNVPLSFQALKERFASEEISTSNVTTKVNSGEINHKILTRHFETVALTENKEDFEVQKALGELTDEKSSRQIVICEKWIAEKNVNHRDGAIFNLLSDKELLYPVVFMMRRCEETLRKFVNLRLLDIQESNDFIDIFIKGLTQTGGIGDNSKSGDLLKDYFYRGYTTHDRFLVEGPGAAKSKVSYLSNTKN